MNLPESAIRTIEDALSRGQTCDVSSVQGVVTVVTNPAVIIWHTPYPLLCKSERTELRIMVAKEGRSEVLAEFLIEGPGFFLGVAWNSLEWRTRGEEEVIPSEPS